MSGPNGHQHAGQTRFKIASQLGGFRDTVTLSDPFGTGARFVIHRNGSNAHREWFKDQLDKNPISMIMAEELLGEEPVVLTDDERKLVEAAQKATDGGAHLADILSIMDRLVSTTGSNRSQKSAMLKALKSGAVKPSEVNTRGLNDQLDEALFTLKSWADLPGEDDDGNPITIPYSIDAARELLMNDTPLADCGMDDLILGVDAWRIDISGLQLHELELQRLEHESRLLVDDPEATVERVNLLADRIAGKKAEISALKDNPVYIMIPGLTLGRAYQYWILRRSHDTALFKSKVVEAAAKNSLASSEISSLSGDATNSEAPASS